jgi:DNA-binding NarL/FixJ family response regulator
MPEMGGKELAQLFRKRYPNARVLFMSGYTDEMILQQGVEHREVAFIQKPCTPSKLVMKLREVLDGK